MLFLFRRWALTVVSELSVFSAVERASCLLYGKKYNIPFTIAGTYVPESTSYEDCETDECIAPIID